MEFILTLLVIAIIFFGVVWMGAAFNNDGILGFLLMYTLMGTIAMILQIKDWIFG